MEAMRQSWTDDRMDDLKRNVDLRFEQVDKRFEQVDRRFEEVDRRFELLHEDNRQMRSEMTALRAEVKADNRTLANELRTEIRDRSKAMERRFDVLLGAILSGFVGLIASQIFG